MMNRPVETFDPRKINCIKHNLPLVGIIMKKYGEGSRLLCLQCIRTEAKSKTIEFEEVYNILTKKALDVRLQEVNNNAGKFAASEKLSLLHDMLDNVFDDMLNAVQIYRREVKKALNNRLMNSDDENTVQESKNLHRNLAEILENFAEMGEIVDGDELEAYVSQFISFSKSVRKLRNTEPNPQVDSNGTIEQAKFVLHILENNLKSLLGPDASPLGPLKSPLKAIRKIEPNTQRINDNSHMLNGRRNSDVRKSPLQSYRERDEQVSTFPVIDGQRVRKIDQNIYMGKPKIAPLEIMKERIPYSVRGPKSSSVLDQSQPYVFAHSDKYYHDVGPGGKYPQEILMRPSESLNKSAFIERGRSDSPQKVQQKYKASPPVLYSRDNSPRPVKGGYGDVDYGRSRSIHGTPRGGTPRRTPTYVQRPSQDKYYERNEKYDRIDRNDRIERIDRNEKHEDSYKNKRDNSETFRRRTEEGNERETHSQVKEKPRNKNEKAREADLVKRYEELTTDDEQHRRRKMSITNSEKKTPVEKTRRPQSPTPTHLKDDPRKGKPTPKGRQTSLEDEVSVSKIDKISVIKEESKLPSKKNSNLQSLASTVIVDDKKYEIEPQKTEAKLMAEASQDFQIIDTGLNGISSVVCLEPHNQVAVGGFKAITIIDARTWTTTSTKTNAHSSYVNRLVYSIPLDMLFSCSSDCMVRGWSIDSSKNLTIAKEFVHPEAVYGIDIYNFDTIVSCGMFKSIILWNTKEATKTEIKGTGVTSFQCVKVFPWLNAIAAASFDEGNIWIFDFETKALRVKLQGFSKNTFISNIKDDSGKRFLYAAGSDGKVLRWKLDSVEGSSLQGTELYNNQKRFRLGDFSLDLVGKKILIVGTGRYRNDCIVIRIDISPDSRREAKELSVFREENSDKFSLAFADAQQFNVVIIGLMAKLSGKLAVVNRSKLN